MAATGARTELGRIGQWLRSIPESHTPLQVQTRRLVAVLAVLGLLVCAAVAVVYAGTRGEWLEGLLAGLTLAIAMIPEEFGVVLTVFFALGAWRTAQAGVLTRRSAALESLGAASVLCVDETGTLTANRMSIARVYAAGDGSASGDGGPFSSRQQEVIRTGALATQGRPVDPTDLAFTEFPGSQNRQGELAREYPLSDALLLTAQAWRQPGDSGYRIAAKGAPEAVLSVCGAEAAIESRVREEVKNMAAQGLRVLAVAEGCHHGPLPSSAAELRLRFLGLVGLADPLRPRVRDAVEQCRQAGIRVVMITGDHGITAQRIGREAGLEAGEYLSGAEISELTPDETGPARALG